MGGVGPSRTDGGRGVTRRRSRHGVLQARRHRHRLHLDHGSHEIRGYAVGPAKTPEKDGRLDERGDATGYCIPSVRAVFFLLMGRVALRYCFDSQILRDTPTSTSNPQIRPHIRDPSSHIRSHTLAFPAGEKQTGIRRAGSTYGHV